MRTIQIFLASSGDLLEDRDKFDLYVRNLNDQWIDSKNIRFKIVRWEYGQEAMSKTRKQDDYNQKLQACEIFVMLYSNKVGMYTHEEFDHAVDAFLAHSKPKIYTYFKNDLVRLGDLRRNDLNSLFDFQDKLMELGHFTSRYESTESLNLHFSRQLDLLYDEGFFTDEVPVNQHELQHTLKEIRAKISGGSTLLQILTQYQDKLLSFAPKEKKAELDAELVNLKANLSNFESEQRIGLLSYDKANQRRTRLTFSFLEMLNTIEANAGK